MDLNHNENNKKEQKDKKQQSNNNNNTNKFMTEQICRDVTRAFFAEHSLVAMHIRSFNYFVTDLIPQIVRERSVLVVRSRSTPFVHVVRFGHVTFCKPTVMTPGKYLRRIMPSEARMKGLNYSFSVFVDMTHEVYENPTHNTDIYGTLMEQKEYREMSVCDIPAMVGSIMCYTVDNFDPIEHDECIYDTGGYYIVNGNPKVMMPQINMRVNCPYISECKTNNKYAYCLEFRSRNENKLRSTSTMKINITRSKGGSMPEIYVTIPFIDSYEIPLASLFRLMGTHNVDDMRMYIVGSVVDSPLLMHLDYLARPCLVEACPGSTIAELQEYIGSIQSPNKNPELQRRYVEHIIYNEVFPNVGLERNAETQRNKVVLLGYLIRKLLLVYARYISPDDRDHHSMKRSSDDGMLCALQFRFQYRQLLKWLNNDIYKATENGNYVTLTNFVNSKKMSAHIRTAFSTGDWSTTKNGITALKGVVQPLSHTTAISVLGHLRRVNTPLNREGKAAAPRQLHVSSFNVLCPVETPEGAPCGLVHNIAMGCISRPHYNSDCIVRLVKSLGIMKTIVNCNFNELTRFCLVLVNGTIIGTTEHPLQLRQELRMYRRVGDIPWETSIYYNEQTREFMINCDGGAYTYPCFNLEEIHKVPEIHQRMHHNAREFWYTLLEEGCIEYIDKDEENMIVLADQLDDLKNNTSTSSENNPNLNPYHPFTHMALHPIMMLGVTAGMIPLPEHNQAPRNMYQSSMGKQAVGVPFTNHVNRNDTELHILHSGQRPLVSTYMSEVLSMDELPAGQNALVALGTLRGYNQEDSCIINKQSLDMGMFRSCCFVSLRDQEKQTGSDKEKFGRPNELETKRVQFANYNKIDPETGLVYPGTEIEEDDVTVGKNVTTGGSTNRRKSEAIVRDRSQVWKEPEKAVVDTVMITSTTAKEDARYVRIKFRSQRIPMVGDKLSSRHAQKSIIGRVEERINMPYTQDGLVPDIIINPHAFPSRMTIAHLIEMLLGTAACLVGRLADGTPFQKLKIEDIGDVLAEHKLPRYGDYPMFSGETGELMEGKIFMGLIFYQRLRHQVIDKMHARRHGPRLMLTRQPQEGRGRDGGLRFGEMERDAILSHGGAEILRDRLFINSDYFQTFVCGNCGLLAEHSSVRKRRYYNYNVEEKVKLYCRNCKTSEHVVQIEIPYALKLLVQELGACGIACRFDVEKVDEI